MILLFNRKQPVDLVFLIGADCIYFLGEELLQSKKCGEVTQSQLRKEIELSYVVHLAIKLKVWVLSCLHSLFKEGRYAFR